VFSKEIAMIKDQLLKKNIKLGVVGLGYVGMPIAVEFAKMVNVIGFDINEKKIETYLQGIDPTKEVGDSCIKESRVEWTSDPTKLGECGFIIVAVPTPVHKDTTPDLSPVISSSTIVGKNIRKGTIVVFESTVYPGVTEEICEPIIEKESGLKCGVDFKIEYSPERINPGDKLHRLPTIKKIVSGMDKESLDEIAVVYGLVVKAGVYKAESIKVAEAAKVIENSQRDINIAFVNELSIIFDKMGIDTLDVLKAASTKWNFLPFKPGLVGGHCIGIDPYYLTYRAEEFGYHSQIILAGRKLNDDMGKYVAENAVKKMIFAGIPVKDARVGILGITFKENCPDARNSKVVDIFNELKEYGITPIVCDPVADEEDVFKFYGIHLCPFANLKDLDCLIIAVAHDAFANLEGPSLDSLFRQEPNDKKVIIDVKGLLNKETLVSQGYVFWRL
jgi:UDP-N-acetyl-D-galactosamine dehydrogenase